MMNKGLLNVKQLKGTERFPRGGNKMAKWLISLLQRAFLHEFHL